MRQSPCLKSSIALSLLAFSLLAAGPFQGREEGGTTHDRVGPVVIDSIDATDSVRVDRLSPIPPGIPARVRARTLPGVRLPAELTRDLESKLRADWPAATAYGSLEGGVALSLVPPLGNFSLAGGVVVPVVGSDTLEIRGRVELPPSTETRRVVVVVDASASANAPADSSEPGQSILSMERRALRGLLQSLADAPDSPAPARPGLEIGIVAFGEKTWEVAKPTSDYSALIAALDVFEREHPDGYGRTDTVCALWTAFDRLDRRSPQTDNEIVLLTDGDLPHSGRFLDCRRQRRTRERRLCEARRNRTSCPAQVNLSRTGRSSDLRQLDRLAGRFAGRVRVSPIIFQASRRTNAYTGLASRTGGTPIEVPSIAELTTALTPAVTGRVEGASALNLTTGSRSPNLLADGGLLAGELSLAPGPNDVEVSVDAGLGRRARYRFRVYSASREMSAFLDGLRSQNQSLRVRLDRLQAEGRDRSKRRRRTRRVEVVALP